MPLFFPFQVSKAATWTFVHTFVKYCQVDVLLTCKIIFLKYHTGHRNLRSVSRFSDIVCYKTEGILGVEGLCRAGLQHCILPSPGGRIKPQWSKNLVIPVSCDVLQEENSIKKSHLLWYLRMCTLLYYSLNALVRSAKM